MAFSADDKAVAIAIFDYLDFKRRSGGIEFWRVSKDSARPTLERTGFRLSVTRGSHQLVLAP